MVLLDMILHALLKIFVPHLGVPCVEPAGEGQRLLLLLNGGDGGTTAPRGVRVHVVLG